MDIIDTTHRLADNAIGHVLAALGAGSDYEFVAPEGLSSAAVYVPAREAIVAQTIAAAPFFRSGVEASAMRYAADVVLLRIGDTLRGTGPITADVALAAPPCAAWVECDLTLWSDGFSVWLVSEAFGPAVEVSTHGFTVALLPPYQTLDERECGIEQASRIIAGRLQLVEAL